MDGSGTSRQATVWVIVHIQDENDNQPEFPETVYRISVPERGRSKRGYPIYRVFAYDRDEGANADLTYSIVDGNQDGKFFIDPKTAMVSSRKMLTAGSYDILTVRGYTGPEGTMHSLESKRSDRAGDDADTVHSRAGDDADRVHCRLVAFGGKCNNAHLQITFVVIITENYYRNNNHYR